MEETDYYYLPLTDEEEAEYMGISIQTIKKYHKSLIKKGYLEIIELDGEKVKRFKLPKE
jgi:predicted transcriptional regulator